jgi:primosomal protein N' (replication factor Y)
MAVAELNKISAGVVGQLAKAGWVRVIEREQSLDAAPVGDVMGGGAPPELTAEQVVAVDEIVAAMGAEVKKPFLLHGVTGSGKTEVYLRVIAKTLDAGKTALVLVPEISLTPQLAARFRARFGDKVAILHSGLSEQARLGEWSRLHRGEASIAVGARSAVFAPLGNIGVIVVEEHDGSFKQDEGVRYHARDVALVRAQRAGAVAVLGSATPSLESYAHTERGVYRLLTLTVRPTARPMPEVQIVDLRTHMPDTEAFLSSPLRNAIGETLANGEQTILPLLRHVEADSGELSVVRRQGHDRSKGIGNREGRGCDRGGVSAGARGAIGSGCGERREDRGGAFACGASRGRHSRRHADGDEGP